MNRFSIISKKDEKSKEAKQKVKTRLLEEGFIYDKSNPELVITIGGDGTLLYAVHKYLDILNGIQFLAIHTGTLGFYTDYTEHDIEQAIQDIINNKPYEIFESKLLEVKVNKDSTETYYALNEVRIENVWKTQTLDIYIDGEFFETVRGNGMCLSTQAGSTAYNRALKGAVIDSGLEVMQLCEIAGLQNAKHSSLGSPYIMKSNRKVTFVCDESTNAVLCYDHLNSSIENTKTITCCMSDKKVTFIRYKKYSYLERLRNLY